MQLFGSTLSLNQNPAVIAAPYADSLGSGTTVSDENAVGDANYVLDDESQAQSPMNANSLNNMNMNIESSNGNTTGMAVG